MESRDRTSHVLIRSDADDDDDDVDAGDVSCVTCNFDEGLCVVRALLPGQQLP